MGDDWDSYDDSSGGGEDWGDWGDWGDSNYGEVEESETYQNVMENYQPGDLFLYESPEERGVIDQIPSDWVNPAGEGYQLPSGLEEATDTILSWFEEGKTEREEFQKNVDTLDDNQWWADLPTMDTSTSKIEEWFKSLTGGGAEVGNKPSGAKPTEAPKTNPLTSQPKPRLSTAPSASSASSWVMPISIAAVGLAVVLLLRKK